MAVANILKALQAQFSSPSADRIPQSIRTKIAANGFGTDGVYEPDEMNAIYKQMVNKIAKLQNFNFVYSGVNFEKYNKGFLAYGDAIVDNFVDIADVVEPYKLINAQGDNGGVTTTDPYKIKWANVKTAYYVGTYELKYQMTTTYYEVKKAFISDASVTNFVGRCRAVLPESLKYDRYIIARDMLASDEIYAVSKDFKVASVSPTEPIFTAEQAMDIITQIKNYADYASFSSRQYNKLGVMTSIKDGEDGKNHGVLFINKGIYNALKTALKNVYHNEIDFGVDNIEFMPDFGPNAATNGHFASLLDDRGLYLWDTLQPYSWNIWTGDGLYWNDFLHYQGKIGYALHRTSVRFTLTEEE